MKEELIIFIVMASLFIIPFGWIYIERWLNSKNIEEEA